MARKKGTQAQDAYNYIRDRILTFEFLPGTELSDSRLEQELDMSRSPIRESIIELIADGLLVRTGNKVLIAPLNLQDIIEICEVRKALEVAAVTLVLKRGGPCEADMQRLQELLNGMQKAETMENYALDDEFHSILLQASGNGRMVEIANRMRLQISRARYLNVFIPSRLRDANVEHQQIFDALKTGDAIACERAMALHMDNSQKNFEAVLNNPQFSPHMLRGIALMVSDNKAQ